MIKKLLQILLLVFVACKKEKQQVPAINFSDFPITVGSSWTYLVTNFPPTQTDTAVFKISGGPYGINPAYPVYSTKTSISGNAVDSGLLSTAVSPKSVGFTGNNGVQTYAGSGLFDGWALAFPINEQSSWSLTGGTVKVAYAQTQATISGKSYNNVYTLVRSSITPGGTVTDTMKLAPGIGIVQYNNFPLFSCNLQ